MTASADDSCDPKSKIPSPPGPTTSKKRRQHHVWQKYLRAWSIEGQLFCLMDGKIFPAGTTVTAVENYFYKIGELTAADIALIKFLLLDTSDLHPLTRKNHEDFLRLVTAPISFRGVNADLDDLIDIFNSNVLEDLHAGIEASFIPLLESALNKDISFYSDKQSRITLFYFLASQHMRTKGIRVRIIKTLKQKNGLDVSRVWAIISHMLATNIGMSLYLESKNRQLILIHNTTDLVFITGDQPLINLHAKVDKSPMTLSWYYPISPRLALLIPEIDEEPTVSTASLTSEQVGDLNTKIVAASHRQVFAQSRSSLEAYAETSSSA